jgi:membrane protein implicated in regulation of membrane protease activity
MTWWTWIILGAVFLGAEMLAIDAQFYLVFLGVSAALIGIAALLGIVMPEWAQWVSFAVLALIFMVTFRKSLYLKLRAGAKGFRASLVGDTVKLTMDLAPGQEARIEHRGSKWTALNIGDAEIGSGAKAKIVKVDGLILHIRAD